MNYRDKEKQNIEIEIENNIDNNIYYKNNPQYFNELRNICLNNPLGFASLLRHSKRYLKDWIDESIPQLRDSFYVTKTKIYWILTGLIDFPVCKKCGKKIEHKNIRHLNQTLIDFCSYRCQTLYFLPKINDIKIKKYGDIWNMKKIKQGLIKKYGVDNIQKLSVVHKYRKSNYFYNGIYFDSKPEIATYIYYKENGYDVMYHPDKYFEYVFDNIQHRYFPDFKINERYYEIKGDHFFKDDKMICPFKNKKWNYERYQYECDKYNEKYKCMKLNKVQILKYSDYSKFIEYVINKYGKKYFDNYRIIKQ